MPNTQNPREFYETPRPLIRYLMAKVPTVTGRCFEPCAGNGAIVEEMENSPATPRRKWVTNDIDRRWKTNHCADATKTDLWKKVGRVDWTITNPAFSTFIPVMRRALHWSDIGVAMYGRISINEVLKEGDRRTILSRYPPSMILFLPRFAYRRSPKTGKWTTDSMTCCWMVWFKADVFIPGSIRPPQVIDYAPERVIDELDDMTQQYRDRMDKLTRWKKKP